MQRTRSLALLAGSALSLAAAQSALAQISWNNAAGGSWHTASNWNPVNEPDNAGEDAEISLPGIYTVALTTNRTIRNLFLYNSDASLTIGNGTVLSLAGPDCITDGTITINPSGGPSATVLSLPAGATLTGIGDTIINASSGVLDRAYVYNPAQSNWFNDFGHVIRGRGRLYYSFTNNGILRADVASNLLETIQGTVTSNGFIEAVNGATFSLNGSAINQSGGGQINVSGTGSTLSMVSATITGGSLSATSGGAIVSSSGSQTWNGPISASGPVNVLNSTAISLNGVLTHTGTITVNSNSGGSVTAFSVTAGSTIGGTGTLTLNATSGSLDRAQLFNPAQNDWTHAAGHTINGKGRIYYSFTNNGLITASAPAENLELLQGAITNNGTIEANAGYLHLTTETINNANGIISATNSGNVYLTSATLNGGTLTTSGSSKFFSNSSTQTLTGTLTSNATIDILNGSHIAVTSSITHNGITTINSNSGGSVTSLQVTAGTTLGGSGTVVLNATSGALDRAQLFSPSQAAWTHGPNHTIRGRGNIYYNLVNNGTISADMPNETIQFQSGTITNNSNIRTLNGGILQFTSSTFNQSPTGVIAASNGDVRCTSSTISGGTMTSAGASAFVVNGGTLTLSGGVTVNATTNVLNSTSISCPQGLINNAVITVNSNNGGSVTPMTVAAGTTISGTGSVVLNATSGALDRAQLYSPSQAVWTHAAGHSIRGSGRIYYSLINNGLISADAPGRTLELTSGTFTNNASIQTAGGTLSIVNSTIAQSPTGTTSAANGNILLTSAAFSGGTVSSTGANRVTAITGTQSLSGGVTLYALFDLNNAAAILSPAGFTNNGTITINSNSGGSPTICQLGAGAIIQGTGSIVLNATAGIFDRAYLYAPSGSFTNALGHTIAGSGNVYSTWTNSGTVKPSGPSRAIACQQGPYTQSASGTLAIELAGTATGQFGRLIGPQPKALAGTLSVSAINGFVPPCGSSYTIITGPITGTFSSVSLPGVPVGEMYVTYSPNAVTINYLPSDYNNDGFVDGFDYDDYVQCFEGLGCLPGKSADFNNDGFADGFDYDDFVFYFESGC